MRSLYEVLFAAGVIAGIGGTALADEPGALLRRPEPVMSEAPPLSVEPWLTLDAEWPGGPGLRAEKGPERAELLHLDDEVAIGLRTRFALQHESNSDPASGFFFAGFERRFRELLPVTASRR